MGATSDKVHGQAKEVAGIVTGDEARRRIADFFRKHLAEESPE